MTLQRNIILRLAFLLLVHHEAHAFPQPFEYLTALDEFAYGFLHPEAIVPLGAAPVLAPDVVGRVDIANTIVGAELNTDYLYGLFLTNDMANTTQIIGKVVSESIQSLVVEPPVVSASFIAQTLYSTINFTLPVQIDMIIRFIDDLRVISYDVTLRRWAEAMDYMIPKLAPQIALELNQTYVPGTSNDTGLLVLRAATDICNVAAEHCTGNNTQYRSLDACRLFLTQEIPFGDAWGGAQNTGWCRYIQKDMVQYRPDSHCPSIGPAGGDMCIDRDYVEVVDAFPFQSTLVAPNATFSAGDAKGLSSASLNELMKLSMENISATTVAFYPVPAIVYSLILYMCAKLVEYLLGRYSREWPKLSFLNRRNTVTYFLNTFWTTVTLALQLTASPIFAQDYSYDRINISRLAVVVISGLYIFELVYRQTMRWPLLIHHFCTIFAIVLVITTLQITMHPALSGIGLMWLFHATTEQSLFVGLIMYRLKFSKVWTQRTLYFAAVQSLLFKMAFSIYLFVWWGMKLAHNDQALDVAFSVLFGTILSLLMVTQVYGSWAAWSLAAKVNHSRTSEKPPALEDCESPRELELKPAVTRTEGSSNVLSSTGNSSQADMQNTDRAPTLFFPDHALYESRLDEIRVPPGIVADNSVSTSATERILLLRLQRAPAP